MHIPENYISPETCAVMTAAMVPVWVHAVKKVNAELPKEKIPQIGIGAAFSFLAMMFNIPLIGGTTGHAVGGTLIALLFGPNAACLAVSIALLLQAVIFGDGGILALGANCFNMAFALPYLGYAIYELIRKTRVGSYIAAGVASYLGLQIAALLTAVEFGIQPMIFQDAAGQALYCPYDISIAIPAMMIPHLAVAGFVEAGFTVAIFAFITKTSPDFLLSSHGEKREKTLPIFALVAALIAATPLGLLATGTAWGEWGADEISEIVQNGSRLGYTPKGLTEGWSLDVLMPDYAMEGMNEVVAYILSAIIGVALLVIIFKLISIPMSGRKPERVK